jgi:enoyl-CoA hydratase/carnithine racemase
MDPDEGLAMARLAPPVPGWLAARSVGAVVAAARWLRPLRTLLGGMPLRTAYVNLRLLTDAMERSDKITVAALDGPAFGGGLELALACDLRVAADRPDGWIAQPEVLAGVMAGFGATQRLPELVGLPRALELLLLCEAITPAQALSWGLVNRLLPAEGYDAAVGALARRLAGRPAAAVAGTKRAARAGRRVDVGHELRQMLAVWGSPAAERGLGVVAARIREELGRGELRPLPEILRSLEGSPGSAQAAGAAVPTGVE